MRVGPRLLQHLREHLGRLRAGDAVLLVDHEERDARGAVGLRLLDVRAHLGLELAGREHLVDPYAVEAGRHRDLAQHGVVGDVAGPGEVRLEQRLLHPALEVVATLGMGEVDQPVRVDGVEVERLGQPVDQPLLGRDGLHAVLHLLRALGRLAVLLRQHHRRALRRLGGRSGVELVGAPVHLHLVGVAELGQRVLDAALADVAPGADDVGPDLDLHDRRNTVGPQGVPDSTPDSWRCTVERRSR